MEGTIPPVVTSMSTNTFQLEYSEGYVIALEAFAIRRSATSLLQKWIDNYKLYYSASITEQQGIVYI